MQPLLFDTSIYISALRRGQDATLSLGRLFSTTSLWLSAVVLQELYAGAKDRDRHLLARLESDFGSLNRILVPNLSDWTQAGKVLSHLADKYGYEQIGRGRLANDALIGISAGRLGITVITANEGDFSKLAEFSKFQWQVGTF